MKKISKIIFVLITILLFGNKNAFALGGTYQYNGFTYTINNIHLDVYRSKLDADNNYDGYNKRLLYSLDLPDSYTINPSYYDMVDNSNSAIQSNSTYIILNLNITKDEILELLKSKINIVDNDNHYFIRMMVDYTINGITSGLSYYYQDVYDNSNNNIIENSTSVNNRTNMLMPLLIGQSYSEPFANFEYKLVNNNAVSNYTTEFTKGMPIYLDYYLNSTIYSSADETKNQVYEVDGYQTDVSNDSILLNNKIIKRLNFVGYSNIQEIIENNYYDKYFMQEVEKKVVPTEIATENGILNLFIYGFCTILVIIGSFLLVRVIREKIYVNAE